MAQIKVTPYLFFGGNCREVMESYKSIFDGELTLTTYAEGPPDAHENPESNSPGMKDKIMHAKLEGEIVIMASDSPFLSPGEKIDSFSLSLEGSDAEKLTGYFNKLAAGGHIQAPLTKQFWGDTFGMLKDKYGVSWMVSITAG